jgi:hypothetical protein
MEKHLGYIGFEKILEEIGSFVFRPLTGKQKIIPLRVLCVSSEAGGEHNQMRLP